MDIPEWRVDVTGKLIDVYNLTVRKSCAERDAGKRGSIANGPNILGGDNRTVLT